MLAESMDAHAHFPSLLISAAIIELSGISREFGGSTVSDSERVARARQAARQKSAAMSRSLLVSA